MSMFGTARFTWTDTEEKLHTLNVPLQKVKPAVRLRRWVRESINFTNREVWYAGDGVYEIVAEIRYDENPQSLVELILAGLKGITITYYDGFSEHECEMVAPTADEFVAGFDDHQATQDWHRVEIRLRKTDGSAFTPSVFKNNLLFLLDPAQENVPSYTFTRSHTSGVSGRVVGSDGFLRTYEEDQPRIEWEWSNWDDVGLAPDVPGLLIESPARSNITLSDDLVNDWGVSAGTPSVSGGRPDPTGGVAAYTFEQDTDPPPPEGIEDPINGLSGAGVRSACFLVKENVFGAAGAGYFVVDSVAGTVLALTVNSYTNGRPNFGSLSAGNLLGVRPLNGGWWAAYAQTDSFMPNTVEHLILGPQTAQGSLDVFRAIFYDNPVPAYSILDAGQTRNAETYFAAFPHVPQAMCGLIDFRELEVPDWSSGSNQRLVHIGDASNNNPRLFITRDDNTDEYDITHTTDEDTVNVSLDINPQWGDRIQLVWRLFLDGSVQLHGRRQALGSTTWSTWSNGSQSSGLALASAWSAERLYLGSVGAGGRGSQLYHRVAIYGGSDKTLNALVEG